MPSTRPFLWIFIFLCGPFLTNAQTSAEDHKLFLKLERAIYENQGNDSIVNLSLVKKSKVLKESGYYLKAIKTLERANSFSQDELQNYQIRYELALNNFLLGEYKVAESYLLQIKHFTQDTEITNKILPLEIFTLNELMRWDKSREVFEEYTTINSLSINIDSLYGFKDNIKLKKVKTARWLSIFLPGIGQMYAGYWFKGLVSGGVQAILVGYSALSLYNGYFFSGAVTGVALFYTFYVGGIDLAEDLVHEKNKKIIEKHNSKIRNYILLQEAKKNGNP